MMFALPLLSLLLATTSFAAPSLKKYDVSPVPASALQLPSNQTQLVRPDTDPNYVVIGVGNQNYTCTDSGNYTYVLVFCIHLTTLKKSHRSVGTVAQMFDISGLYGTSEFSQIQDDAYDVWSKYQSTDPLEYGLADQLGSKFGIDVIGQYYFISSSNGTLYPKFDFTSSGPDAGNPEAFVVATKAGDIPSPTGSQDIDWLRLQGLSGELATNVFRVFTKAGQPPASVSISRSTTTTHH